MMECLNLKILRKVCFGFFIVGKDLGLVIEFILI